MQMVTFELSILIFVMNMLNNKTKDWALVQNAASAGDKVELGLFR